MDSKIITLGEIYVSREPMKLVTVLGSCVAVCLWDNETKIGGMNHFLFPETNKYSSPADPKTLFRFGNVSVPALIQQMIKSGAKLENLVARIYGGGMVNALEHQAGRKLASRNIEIAERKISEAGLRIAEKNVGGSEGRQVVFDTGLGSVSVKAVKMEAKFADKHGGQV